MGEGMTGGTERRRGRDRKVAAGVLERHTEACELSGAKKRPRCTCAPVHRARVRVGERGAQRLLSETFPTLAEAVAWIAAAKSATRSRTAPEPRRPSPAFGVGARQFLVRAREGKALGRSGQRYSAATIDNYERGLRVHAFPWVSERWGVPLDELPADRIDTRTVQAMVGALAAARSAAVARIAAAAVMTVLRDLHDRELIDDLPVARRLPAPPAGRSARISLADADRLLRTAAEDDKRTGRSLMEPLFALLVGAGLRISEALALRWGPGGLQVDADGARVTVAAGTTKTAAGQRTIGLEPEFAAILRRHRMAMGRPTDAAPVFTDDDGEPLTRDGRVRSGIGRVAKAAGLEGLGPHLLRHSHGSWLGDAGESPTAIAARLGHNDPAFALRRYVHADPSASPSLPLVSPKRVGPREPRRRSATPAGRRPPRGAGRDPASRATRVSSVIHDASSGRRGPAPASWRAR